MSGLTGESQTPGQPCLLRLADDNIWTEGFGGEAAIAAEPQTISARWAFWGEAWPRGGPRAAGYIGGPPGRTPTPASLHRPTLTLCLYTHMSHPHKHPSGGLCVTSQQTPCPGERVWGVKRRGFWFPGVNLNCVPKDPPTGL